MIIRFILWILRKMGYYYIVENKKTQFCNIPIENLGTYKDILTQEENEFT